MIKASCTWGYGPDVLVSWKDFSVILYEDPKNFNRWKHGSVESGCFDLTSKQAKELAYSLLLAAEAADILEESIKEYEKKDKSSKHKKL